MNHRLKDFRKIWIRAVGFFTIKNDHAPVIFKLWSRKEISWFAYLLGASFTLVLLPNKASLKFLINKNESIFRNQKLTHIFAR